jgi:hypothetical protein
MAVAEQAREFLTLDQLHLPSSLPIVALEVEDYVDWSGDDALRINAILDEDAADDDLKVPDVFVMKDRIRQELRQHGIDLFPYVFFAKRSDLAAPVEDDE